MSSGSDWDPKPQERSWYSHRVTGDRGYLVRRGGVDMLRRDLPQSFPQTLGSDWVKDDNYRPLAIGQLARVAYNACQELNQVMGYAGEKRDWLSLPDEERARWLSGTGPDGGREAKLLYKVIWKVLSGMAR
jgi:hypothetical protein